MEKRFQLRRELVEKYPGEKIFHYNLGQEYFKKKLFDKAIAEYERAIALDHNYAEPYLDLGYLYSKMDDFEKAIANFKEYDAINPGEANTYDSIGDVYFIRGDLENAILKYQEAIYIKPDFEAGWKIAHIYALQEDYDKAIKSISDYIESTQNPGLKSLGLLYKLRYDAWQGNSTQFNHDVLEMVRYGEGADYRDLSIAGNWERGWFYYDRESYAEGRKHFEKLYELLKEKKFVEIKKVRLKACINFALALLDLKQGLRDSAEKKLHQMKAQIEVMDESWMTREIKYYYGYLSIEILLAQDKIDSAITAGKELKSTNNWVPTFYKPKPYRTDVLARAYVQNGDIVSAIGEYEQLTTLYPQNNDRCLRHPAYHYRLAKLYEQKGQLEKAIARYKKFIELWKNADKDLPELIDAKKCLAQLTNKK